MIFARERTQYTRNANYNRCTNMPITLAVVVLFIHFFCWFVKMFPFVKVKKIMCTRSVFYRKL